VRWSIRTPPENNELTQFLDIHYFKIEVWTRGDTNEIGRAVFSIDEKSGACTTRPGMAAMA
jgi:hypothetical protein